MAPGQPPYTKVTPTLPSSYDDADRAEQRRLLKQAWADWDEAVAMTPMLRQRLAEIDELLPQLEANLRAADAALERARGDYILREIIGPGGGVLTDPSGRPMVMVEEAEENRDAGVVLAKAERTKWEQARGRLWARQAHYHAVIARGEYQKPPGERPRD